MVEKNTDCEWETVNNTGEDQRDDVTEEKWEIKKKKVFPYWKKMSTVARPWS